MSTAVDAQLREDALNALRSVIDPELGENLVDLGLIYRVDVDGAAVRVEMSTTTKGCPAASFLRHAVYTAVSIVPGVETVEVELTYDPPWTPDMMEGATRNKFGMYPPGARR